MGLRRPRPGPEHHDNSRPPTAPPVCLEADLFPAGLESAKGVTCSPPARLALSRPAVRWGRVGESGGGGPALKHLPDCLHLFPPTGAAPAHFPTASALVPTPTSGTCLVCSYLLPMFNSWLGVGSSFPRKGRIPLGYCPVPARPQGTWLWPPRLLPGFGAGSQSH